MTNTNSLSNDDMCKVLLKDISVTPLYNANKRSIAWKYFGTMKVVNGSDLLIFNDKRVFCKECLDREKAKNARNKFNLSNIKNFSATTSTGNLTQHLENDHNIRDTPAIINTSSKTMQSFFTPVATNDPSNRKRKLVFDIVLLCCRDLFPFNFGEGQGWIDFCKKHGIIADPSEIPCRTTISRALDFVYQHCKAEVIKSIAKHSPDDVAMTFDQWTDKYRRRPYNTNTLHYWDDDFNDINLTLKTNWFPKRHTGENILAEVESVMEEFGIQNKNVYMVTDAAKNVRKACRLGHYENPLCLGHGMHNLVYTDGIKKTEAVSNIIFKIRQIVKSLRYKTSLSKSSSLEQEMSDVSEMNPYFDNESEESEDSDDEDDIDEEVTGPNNPNKIQVLKLDVVHRWYSQLFMLKSVNKRGRQQINTGLQKYGRDDLCLSRNEFDLINDLCEFFEKFQKITKILSGEKYTTVNMACVFRSELFSSLESDNNDRDEISDLKENMRKTFDKRFPMSELIVVAALLDPRCQNLMEVKDFLKENCITAFELLKKWAIEYVPVPSTNDPTPTTRDQNLNFIEELVEKHSTLSSVKQGLERESELNREIHFLLSLGVNVKVESVRLFWKAYSSQMPILSRLARKVLPIPMTSTPSERNFSIAGVLVNSRKSALLPSNLDKMLFVHNNYEFCKNIALDKFEIE